MAHRPLVRVSVGTRCPAVGPIPTCRLVTVKNDRNRRRIPPNQLLIIAWGQVRRPSAPRRSDAGASGEGELPRTGRRRRQFAPYVVPSAEHLIADGGGGARS